MAAVNDLPLGFGMALAQHPEAMQRFANMSDAQKSEVISELHNIKSKEEMQQYVYRMIVMDDNKK